MPQLLQIYHEALKPGGEAAYSEIEEDTARMCARYGCPHPYLAAESLTGRKEAWFFNGYESTDEQQQVADDYRKKPSLMEALLKNSNRKASLVEDRFDVVARYREDLSRGPTWTPGQGRFLVITITKEMSQADGAVFEAPDGTRFIVHPVDTRGEAEAIAARAGHEVRVLAVRPAWSYATTGTPPARHPE